MPQENIKTNTETDQPFLSAKEKLDQITSQIEQGIKDVFESENYKSYLSVMSRFHNYSLNNCMLIYMKNPKATKVASYKSWKEKFDRHVMQGEKGIDIIAPMPYTKKIDVQKIDPDTKKPLKDDEGNPVLEQKEVTMPGFKAVKVFDVSQTEGKPLPELVHSLSGKVENYKFLKEAIRKSAPVPVEFRELESNMDGFFSDKEQKIVIREGMSEPQTLCAMVHETAHSILHNSETSNEKKTRSVEEVEAESVAYAVCKYFGIDTDENSFGYLAAWSKDKDTKELRDSLGIINSTSSFLINTIEDKYNQIMAEKELTPAEELSGKICKYLKNVGTYQYNEEVPEMIMASLLVGDMRTIESVLDLTLTQQEGYPHNKEISENDKNIVELLHMEMRDYEKFNFTDVTYKIADKIYLEIQRQDDGCNYDYSIYDINDYRLKDGGYTDFDIYDEYADMPLFNFAKDIAEDYGIVTDDITIADESVLDKIEKANDIEGRIEELEAKANGRVYIAPPCPELTYEMMKESGYTFEGMYPITKEVAKELMNGYCEVYLLYDDDSEAMANDETEIQNHYGYTGVQKEDWEAVADRYLEDSNRKMNEKAFLESKREGFAIYQDLSSGENDDKDKSDYSRFSYIYSDELMKDERSTERILDEIFEQFSFKGTVGNTGRYLSDGDIIALRHNGELTFNYIGDEGYEQVPVTEIIGSHLKSEEIQKEESADKTGPAKSKGKKKEKKTEKDSVISKLETAKRDTPENFPSKKTKERGFEHEA